VLVSGRQWCPTEACRRASRGRHRRSTYSIGLRHRLRQWWTLRTTITITTSTTMQCRHRPWEQTCLRLEVDCRVLSITPWWCLQCLTSCITCRSATLKMFHTFFINVYKNLFKLFVVICILLLKSCNKEMKTCCSFYWPIVLSLSLSIIACVVQ